FGHVFKAQVFMTDLANFNAFDEVWKEYFEVPPARTTVGTTGLLVPGTLVEIDLIGYVPGQGIEGATRAAFPRSPNRILRFRSLPPTSSTSPARTSTISNRPSPPPAARSTRC